MTQQELQSLILSSTKLLNDLGLHHASESATLKLLASVPVSMRREVELAADRVHVDVTTWKSKEESIPCMKTVQTAVFANKQIHFRYRKNDGLSERTAGALGLVCKGSIWYLVAESDGDIKSYRLSRLEDARVLECDAHRPDDFRLDEFWHQSIASLPSRLPRYPVTLLCAQEHVVHLYNAGHWSSVESVEQADCGDYFRVFMLFERDLDALQCVLEHSPNVRVIQPVELRQKVISVLEEALELYRIPVL